MEELILNELSKINITTFIAIFLLAILLYSILEPWFIKIKNLIIDKYKSKSKSEDLARTVDEDHKKMIEYEQNRIADRKQSLEIQKQLVKAIEDINKKIDEFQKTTDARFKESKAREDKRTRAELKDRIGQSYRFYHEQGKWNHMEKEALEDLITEYEDAGGDNSFVHSKVQQEMYTWELID